MGVTNKRFSGTTLLLTNYNMVQHFYKKTINYNLRKIYHMTSCELNYSQRSKIFIDTLSLNVHFSKKNGENIITDIKSCRAKRLPTLERIVHGESVRFQ